MSFIKNNKMKILTLIIAIISIPYIYIIINVIFQLGRVIGNIVRIKMGF